MHLEFDALDFERRFLADLLGMLAVRLTTLHGYVDRERQEESDVFDPMEHLAGIGVVAAQRYIASICNWLSVDREQALQLGPRRKGVPIASVIHAAANYWKHIEDGDGQIRPATRRVLEQLGVRTDADYCVTNTLYECGYSQLQGLMDDLIVWRDAVIAEQQQNG